MLFHLQLAVGDIGISLLFNTGGSFALEMFNKCGLLDGDVAKMNFLLWKLEEVCLPKVIVMYEEFKRAENVLKQNLFGSNTLAEDSNNVSGNKEKSPVKRSVRNHKTTTDSMSAGGLCLSPSHGDRGPTL